MAVTVRDVLQLELMKDFKVVAGQKGLNKAITKIEILDFEFLEEGQDYRSDSFDGESIVLTSLLFAKDRPELILYSIKKLIKFGVCALAYKPVIFKELPGEAIEYADAHDFPILEFGKDEFFEEIIFAVSELTRIDNSVGLVEPLIEEMIARDFSPEEAETAHEKINPLFRPQVMALCIKDPQWDENKVYEVVKKIKVPDKIHSKTYVGKYRDKFMIILSQDEADEKRFRALYEDVVITYGLNGADLVKGVSNIRALSDGFDKIIKEAYWSYKIAEIENVPVRFYKTLGIYKLIVSQIESQHARDYMNEYLKPLFDEEDKDGELLRTAVEYVQCKGDAAKTAEVMFCHKNTIRYRLGKLQEKLDKDSEEKEFYQNLSTAIKIYLLTKDEN